MVMGFPILFIGLVSWRSLRQRDDELRPRSRRAMRRNDTAVALHDLAADREADTRSFVLVAPMQTLENLENTVAIFLVEPDAVVFDGDPPGGGSVQRRNGFTAHLDHRIFTRFLKFQSVADQVLEQLSQLAAISEDHRQAGGVYAPMAFLNADFEIGDHHRSHVAQIHRRKWLGVTRDARQ